MDLRSIVQLGSFAVVFMILFYHFEIQTPQITITWDPPPQNGQNVVIPKQTPVFPPHVEQEQPKEDKNQFEKEDPYYDVYVTPPEIDPPEVKPVVNPVVDRPPVIHESPVINFGELEVDVQLPKVLNECFEYQVIFTAKESLDYDKKLSLMQKLFVDVYCLRSENRIVTQKTLPAFPDPISPSKMITTFFPDESVGECTLTARAESDIKLNGELEKTYTVGEIPPERPYCWHCEGHFFRDVPLAYHFSLQDDEGIYLFEKSKISVQRHQKKTIWIVPHPYIKQLYPQIVNKLYFNAWLESKHILQEAIVNNHYNEARGGYAIEFEGKDAGEFSLYVTLNHIYPFSELNSGDPTPILVSSHIHHINTVCDLERSEVIGSRFTISVDAGNSPDFIFKENPGKCDCAMEAGRWLDVIPLEAECRPPYCTGDRISTMISSMSWQGNRFPWLWIPYDCHYHYYDVEDFQYCAKQKDIKWIHVMGDSLPREFIAYLMTMHDVMDTTKFDHADVVVGDVRLTFQSWQDIIRLNEERIGLPRNKQHIKNILDEFNLLEAGTSKGYDSDTLKIYLDQEDTSPDIFFLNSGNAYALYLQSTGNYVQFCEDFADLVKDSIVNGRKGDGKKTEYYWYGNPFLFGSAHDGTEFITQGRNELFNEKTKTILENAGINYVDFAHLTRTRWEESWDGLHYLRGYEYWTGHVAATYIQAWFNTIFGDCSGPN